MTSAAQRQTADAFGYQWTRRETFDLPATREMARRWGIERYGDIANAPWLKEYAPRPRVLDAGCGAGLAGMEMFGPIIHTIEYVGIDISDAYKTAQERFAERGYPGTFLQADLNALPFPDEHFDIALAEGVLHHTDDTKAALFAVTRKIRRGGRFMFYVYRKKGPVREFCDDYVRDKLQGLTPDEAWEAMIPLTRLGKLLGDLDIEIDIPEEIKLLDIPAGKINLQRFVYWHVLKAFYRPEYTLDEMNHINFDWYAPKNAHRHTLAEVLGWCEEAGLVPERQVEEEAGITIVAKRL